MKYSSDTIGNRTRDLPARSIVPQPTAPPRAPKYIKYLPLMQFLYSFCGTFAFSHEALGSMRKLFSVGL